MEHDLFRKLVSIPQHVRGMLFWIMLYRSKGHAVTSVKIVANHAREFFALSASLPRRSKEDCRVSAEFGRKNRPVQDLPAVPTMSMKRSSNISLIVMGALAFTASFAGGSAYMGWQQPALSQNCTTSEDGKQVCPTRRSWTYLPAFHYWGWGQEERNGSAAPLAQSKNTNA